jgi:RES domain-containing protein
MALDTGRLGTATLISFAGHAWRHQAPGYNPRSGEGARQRGGRFNPPRSFPVLYLCLSQTCAVAELRRLAERQPIGLDGLLPRHLYVYDALLDRVLDLSDAGTRNHLDVDLDTLIDNDWTTCQILGVAAHALGTQAIRTPAATGVGEVLVVFPENLGVNTLEPHLAREWLAPTDVKPV